MRPRSGLSAAIALLLIAGVAASLASGQEREARKEKRVKNPKVLDWVREAPFSDPVRLHARPNFSYEQWFARGRALPDVVDTLVELLNNEDPANPSGDGMRVAYGLGWIGDRRKPVVDALIKSLNSTDHALRSESVSALGRLGETSALSLFEELVKNKKEDINVRGNACVSIGRLGIPSGALVLEQALKDPEQFIVLCAQEGLKLLREGTKK